MTPVPSPLPREDNLQLPQPERPSTAFSYDEGEHTPVEKSFGSLMNPKLKVTGNARFHQDYWKECQGGRLRPHL